MVDEDTELLMNFFGPVAFLGPDGRSVERILTSVDVQIAARGNGLTLVPNTLAGCMAPRPTSPDPVAEPLAIAATNGSSLLAIAETLAGQEPATHPHFVDTRAIEWVVNANLPDIAIKVLRISEETGTVSLMVRHNGVAGPHYHLGAADFLILSGHLGYRAGPPEGYGPGVWFYEPAGARHEATQRVGHDVDLIYTANVYGPIQFDEGRDTEIVAVQSWMRYKQVAEASGSPLVHNVFPGDTSLLAWAPLGDAALGTS